MKAVFRRARVVLLALIVLTFAWILRINARARQKRVSKTPRVLLIGAYGNGNFGDDIIGEAIACGVKGMGGSVTIAARLGDTSRLAASVGETVVVGEGIRSLYRTWKLSRGRDIAILGGGGLLEGRPDDVNVQRLILEYLGKLAVCGLRGQRIAIHGIGVSPGLYSSTIVNQAVGAMLRVVDVVGVRDPASAETVARFNADVTLIQDPAIVLFQDWAPKVTKQANTTGVVLLDHHRWPSFDVGSLEVEGKRAAHLAEIGRELVRRSNQGQLVRLLPFHWSDVNVSRDLVRSFLEHGGEPSRIETVPYQQSTSEHPFKLLMSCENVLTMRFHPALAALTSNARVEVIGTLQKLEQLRHSADGSTGSWSYPNDFRDPVDQLRKILADHNVRDLRTQVRSGARGI